MFGLSKTWTYLLLGGVTYLVWKHFASKGAATTDAGPYLSKGAESNVPASLAAVQTTGFGYVPGGY
jgi:hypothetical protein